MRALRFLIVPLAAGLLATAGADPKLLEEFRGDPLRFFHEGRKTDALLCGREILASADAKPEERRRTLEALACIYSALPDPAMARASLLQILTLDPQADLDRPERLPPGVVRAFYALRDSMALASGAGDPALDVRTIAVGDIENASVVPYAGVDLDKFARGMMHLVTTDLFAVSSLRIVDRQRLNALRTEIRLTQNAAIFDPATRLALGRLTGAQSFLFGSLFHEGDGRVRIDLRVVNTETSDQLVAGSITGRIKNSKDLLELEEKLLLGVLAPELDKLLRDRGAGSPEASNAVRPLLKAKKNRFDKNGADYLDLLARMGEAVQAEDRGELGAAADAWNAVLALDPDNAYARSRAATLTATLSYASPEVE